MTHAPETGAINRLHFPAPEIGAGFRRRFFVACASGMKISGAVNKHVWEYYINKQITSLHKTTPRHLKTSAVIIDQSSQVIISVTRTPLSGLEQNSVLIGVGIWYQKNPVRNLHDTRTRNRRQKNGVDLWRRFLERVSWALGFPFGACM